MNGVYLSHHGIKGMKWGVRNGPPYPLSDKQKSRSERPEGSVTKKEKTKNNSIAEKALSKVGNSTLTGCNPVLIRLGVTYAVLLLTPIAVLAANKIKYNREIKKNREKNGVFSDIKRIEGPHSEEQDMAAVNPGYGTGKPEYMSNCTMCTAAYELRRRGYDVEASVSKFGRSLDDYPKWFNIKKEDIYENTNFIEFKKKLKSQPEGARGNISCQVGPFLSNHSMFWEIKNGNLIIRDCQNNMIYDIDDLSIFNNYSSMNAFYRLDNATINEYLIMDAVRPK